MKIGFIGLGNMGKDIASKLVASGGSVTVYDVVPETVKELESLGACAAVSAAEVAGASDIIGLCVRNDEQMREAMEGPSGVLAGARAGSLVALHSTIRVGTLWALAEAAAKTGVRVFDSPVTRVTDSANKDIVFMVSGAPEDVRAARPYLERCAAKIIEAGPLGAAMTIKICNNTLTYLNLVAADEAMNVAAAAGFDPAILAEVGSANGVGSPLFRALLTGSQTQGTPTSASEVERVQNIGEKDLECALDVGRSLGVELPVTSLVRQQIKRALGNRYNRSRS
jgi:3-hydroxyisobutyrate dehydrogenase